MFNDTTLNISGLSPKTIPKSDIITDSETGLDLIGNGYDLSISESKGKPTWIESINSNFLKLYSKVSDVESSSGSGSSLSDTFISKGTYDTSVQFFDNTTLGHYSVSVGRSNTITTQNKYKIIMN